MEKTYRRFYLEVDFDSFDRPKTKEELLKVPYEYGIYLSDSRFNSRFSTLKTQPSSRIVSGKTIVDVSIDNDTVMSDAAISALEFLYGIKYRVRYKDSFEKNFILFALNNIVEKSMKEHRRLLLMVEYFGEDCKLNDATVTIETRSSDRLCVDRVVKVSQSANRQSKVTTTCIVEINIELGTPLPVAAKQARDFVIYHRDTEVKERLTEDEYDDLIFTLDSISN